MSLPQQPLALSIAPLPTAPHVRETGLLGLAIACLIITVWATSLALLMAWTTAEQHLSWTILAVFWQAFLYTGLFITAHDAMHRAVFPRHPQINHLIGAFALLIYGLFSYKYLLKAHWQHHDHPASPLDPDFHDGKHKNGFAWYLYFVKRYWSWWRLLGLIVVYHAMHQLLHVPEYNLRWFWVVPSLLSSVQLFYFGTFLPHREPATGYWNSFRAQSTYRPWLLSFLACYHFGYHLEHHEYPHVPWWRLPAIAQQAKALR
ncbi:MAG TPA: fatty acid desaturase [Coleofasciculaceae cyanobacterium]